MKREDCWMNFSEALEDYLDARDNNATAPVGCKRWIDNTERMDVAKAHMNALTGCE